MGESFPVSSGWSEWRPLPSAGTTTPAVLAELLDGGQAFRWYRTSSDAWIGTWGSAVAALRLGHGGRVEWCAPATLASHVASVLPGYWGRSAAFEQARDALPWRSDAHLARCLEEFPGLHLLRQPFGETLLGFLCSATKQIVQIKQMIALLASRLGQRLEVGAVSEDGLPAATFHRLPTWDELARAPEAALRGCLLGFRARYIAETARFLANHPGWLDATEQLPYAEAKARLCTLPGVGEKVADCVLLFGAGRLEAFPVDVWILRTMATRYGLTGWKPAQLAQFGRGHFGPYAGLAQQFLFAWERRVGRAVVPEAAPAVTATTAARRRRSDAARG